MHLYKQLDLFFQQQVIVLVLVAMAMEFEHKLDCADEFYKPAKFQAIHFEFSLVFHFLFSHRFR